jgi:Helix-turn-helix domain
MSSDNPQRGDAGERRELTDPRSMRAITHPVRLALLEVLALEGPLTATKAGELIGEPPNTCSFHLRQLAKYGFVEEAGSGPGRNRPWRLTKVGMHFSDVHDDPETRLAARGLDRLLRERYFARLQTFYDTRADYPAHWKEVTGASQFVLYVTPEELRAVDEEVTAVFDRFRDRTLDTGRRPSGSLPVEVLLFAYPIRPPAG